MIRLSLLPVLYIFLSCLTACGDSKSKSPVSPTASKPQGNSQNTDFQIDQEGWETKIVSPLAMILDTHNGVVNTTFSIDLEPGEKNKNVAVPFHFEVKEFTAMKVLQPQLNVEGCSKPAQVSKSQLGSVTMPIFLWSKDWVEAKEAKVMTGYEIEEKIDKNSKGTIVLLLKVPSNCTKISGSFESVFK